uniref:CCHC-type domain-containing protein n=1 Tax=Chromera velia CCMP2878 TaxID=1169474 RepID=A0A0G4HXL3_9ALVE|eukprot:Cvel_9283.t1-p1 / transcript=Cvel_9283.t1 / gene=Cvel_9283 / organism=Chromera_velia_CCMP2878 / gene_product=hypothetical protein / transcript_product=hypothetical protein / location=Cvel_scaffold531:13680-14558(+) / protein_length=293 / sequence_SO=supercontig / SO=protein_coding / is_pseudo=false
MTFKKKASLQLKPQYVSDRAKAYEGALLHAAGNFDEVQKTIHNWSAEGYTCEDLLLKVLGDFVKDMSVVKTKADLSFTKFLTRVKGESLKHYLKRHDEVLHVTKGKGFIPTDKEEKKVGMKNVYMSEWTDYAEKASLHTGKPIDDLLFSEIRPFLDRKADAIEYKIAATGASSQKKPSTDEFRASAEKAGAAIEKRKGKGKKPKKGTKKQQQVQANSKETAGKASDGQKCKNCGFVHRNPKYCPAEKAECKKEYDGCGQIGHFAHCCPKKRNSSKRKKESGHHVKQRSSSRSS